MLFTFFIECLNLLIIVILNSLSDSFTISVISESGSDVCFVSSECWVVFFLLFCIPHNFLYLFIYFWLYWVFVSVRGLSLVVASGGHPASWCAGLSLSQPLLLRSTGSRRAGSVGVAHGPSCSAACGIFPDQGSNPCPLDWQADSQPLHHQGSPLITFCWNWTVRTVETEVNLGRMRLGDEHVFPSARPLVWEFGLI